MVQLFRSNQWFSTFLQLQLIQFLMSWWLPNKIILLCLYNCNFTTLTNHKTNIWYAAHGLRITGLNFFTSFFVWFSKSYIRDKVLRQITLFGNDSHSLKKGSSAGMGLGGGESQSCCEQYRISSSGTWRSCVKMPPSHRPWLRLPNGWPASLFLHPSRVYGLD